MRTDRSLALPWILVLLLAAVPACSGGGEAELPSASAETSSAAATSSGRFAGTVTETMDAGSYTYVALEKDGETVWAAGPRTEVAVGDELSIELAMRMEGFRSDALDRTFDAVYFVNELRPPDAPAGGADPHAGVSADPHAGLTSLKPAPDVDLSSIAKAEGGHRIEELWAGRTELVGREVVVRGRVVKYNPGIMGRNWLHLQDGSGDPEAGTHDVTVTTDGTAAVGDLVTVRGKVAVDRDLGAGYRYGLLLEEAEVSRES